VEANLLDLVLSGLLPTHACSMLRSPSLRLPHRREESGTRASRMRVSHCVSLTGSYGEAGGGARRSEAGPTTGVLPLRSGFMASTMQH
jgi:hypothetical protein